MFSNNYILKIITFIGRRTLSECAFCGKYESDVDDLIAGPSVSICNECISVSANTIRYSKNDKCCFCSREKSDDVSLIGDGNLSICHECVESSALELYKEGASFTQIHVGSNA